MSADISLTLPAERYPGVFFADQHADELPTSGDKLGKLPVPRVS